MPHDKSIDPPASWKNYFASDQELPTSVRVDVNADTDAHVKARPWLLRATIAMRTPRPDGLSSSEESAVLWKIEDAIDTAARAQFDAMLVGAITRNGERQLCFYARSAERFDELVATVRAEFAEYTLVSAHKRDATWELYRDLLYPSAEEWQAIKDADVLLVLKRHGDEPEIERAVRHYAYFPVKELRETFWKEFGSQGYRRVDAEERVEGPHKLAFESWQTVDWTSIRERTSALHRGAKEHGGDYDGWETSVERGA